MADGQMSGGAAGPFALIQPWLSGESAQDKLRDYYNRQAQANAGAVAGDPNAPFSGEFATPPGQPAKPLPMGQAPPGPNEPQSTQTPESYGSLLMDLQQQNEAAAGFNKSLAVGLSAFSQPRDREMVSKMFDPAAPPADPFKMGESIMNSMSMQQGQDRANQIARLVNGPQGQSIADAMHMDLGVLKAAIVTDPGMPAKIAQALGTPTDAMRNLTQIPFLQQQLQKNQPSATSSDIGLLTPSLVAAVGPDFAQKAIGDAISYRTTHGGKQAPWVGPGGVNVQAYNQWTKEQGDISSGQAEASSTLSGNVQKTEMLRQKISDLQNNPGLQKILALPNDSPMKIAARDALRSGNDDWKTDAVHYGVLLNDPQALAAISELKEINGQEYTGAIDSLLGHGLRPSQTEVTAVREGFGQTKNIMNFTNIKDYTAQAI